MKVVVAVSQSITDRDLIEVVCNHSGFDLDETIDSEIQIDEADALIAVWDSESTGILDALRLFHERGKPFHLAIYRPNGSQFTQNELMWLDRSDKSKQKQKGSSLL